MNVALAAAAFLVAPATGGVGEPFSAEVRGLQRGEAYEMRLVGPPTAEGVECSAVIGPRGRPPRSRLAFAGFFPPRLACGEYTSGPAPSVPVEPGRRYTLTVQRIPTDGDPTVVARRGIRAVPGGRRCGSVRFELVRKKGVVRELRARGTGCSTAKGIARTGYPSLRRCTRRARCRFRARRYSCRALSSSSKSMTVRCERRRARVTFFYFN